MFKDITGQEQTLIPTTITATRRLHIATVMVTTHHIILEDTALIGTHHLIMILTIITVTIIISDTRVFISRILDSLAV